MSTTSSADDPNLQTTSSPASVHASESFEYAVIHVFLPFQFPNKNEYSLEKNHSLARQRAPARSLSRKSNYRLQTLIHSLPFYES
jgi:hypothetical protein